MSHSDHAKAEQLQALIDSVQAIRAQSFPDIPEALVEEILLHHADAAAQESDLLRGLEKLVDELVNEPEE